MPGLVLLTVAFLTSGEVGMSDLASSSSTDNLTLVMMERNWRWPGDSSSLRVRLGSEEAPAFGRRRYVQHEAGEQNHGVNCRWFPCMCFLFLDVWWCSVFVPMTRLTRCCCLCRFSDCMLGLSWVPVMGRSGSRRRAVL